MNGHRFHIAVLEDNRPDLHIIQQSIRKAVLDCEITTFEDGAEAFEFINDPQSPVPDLMILDLNVPGVEGPSVLNSVRGNTRWAHVSVVAFTASQDPGDIARVKALGADHYVIKPMDVAGFSQFGQIVKEWLERKQSKS